MERGTLFSFYQLPKSNSGLNLDQHNNNNPNPTLTNNTNMNTAPVQPQPCTVREQDQHMPTANVIRIMRRILPLHAKISDDARETIQQCVSEYISFVTSEANERCQREQRKTITVEDILYAMASLGFEDSVGPLQLFINRYRECESGRGCSLKGESSSFKPVCVRDGIEFNDSHFGPVHVPNHGLTHGPNQGLVHGLVHSPTHGPGHGPIHNPNLDPTHGLAHDSVHGSTHGPTHGSVHEPAHGLIHGQANAPSHGPLPPGPYGYDMLNQSMVMSGGRYYHLGSGHEGSGSSGSSAPSMKEIPFFDQFGNRYK